MKTQKIFGLLAVLFISIFSSCSSDSEGTPITTSSFSANIDGQAWQAIENGVYASVSSVDTGEGTQNVLQLIAAKMDQSTVTIQFPIDNLTEGTYNFTGESAGMLSYSNLSSFSLFSSSAANGNFSITISEVNLTDNTISGTFSGTVYDLMESGASKEITNGVFENISYGETGIYSNGYMNLSKNSSNVFTMSDEDPTNSKIMILESDIDNSITVNGYALTTNANFGIYSVKFPKDATPGTYAITANGDYTAAYAGNEAEEFTVSNGSVTIVSHIGNTVKATFNYTAVQGGISINVTNGELEITHLDN